MAGPQFVTPYGRAGPSSRVRVYEWLDRITEPADTCGYLGHHNSSPGYLARHPRAVARAETGLRRIAAARPEQLVLHREASPLSRGAVERNLLAGAGFSVYDLDDALQWDHGEGGLARRWAPKAVKALLAARHADRVVAGSPVLLDWASEHNRDVVLIPSCVDPGAYRPKVGYESADPPRLGWIGSAGNERYLTLIAPALLEVHRRTGARLTLVGTMRPTLGVLEAMIDRIAWSEATEKVVLADIDLGISPMPDEPYTRGKCGYKLLQYAAVGTPLVASPIGVNRDLLERFEMPGPTTIADWRDTIITLIEAPRAERERIGTDARRIVQEEYSYAAWLPRWRAAVGLD
ncbi:MAG: hypothetical protein NVS3B18_16220 [Candidatus Dormibacteria bacterium]